MRGVTQNPLLENILIKNFNSHASCEAWPRWFRFSGYYPQFQLTRLMRGVTKWKKKKLKNEKFQLTRLMRGVTTIYYWYAVDPTHFNSHASCEAWQFPSENFSGWNIFQLTRLMRGVTFSRSITRPKNKRFQLTRLMRGVTNITNF